MIKMLQYKMYPAGDLRCPTTALVFKADNVNANDTLIAEHIATMLSLLKWACK